MKRFFVLLLCLALFLPSCQKAPEEAEPLTAEPTGTGVTTTTSETAKPQTEEKKEITPITISAPSAVPSFTFDHTPSTRELREMAVRAMHEALSVRWTPAETIRIEMSSRDLTLLYFANHRYAGLPYTGASSGLFQWLEYVDPETGILDGVKFEYIKDFLGSDCAQTVEWAWRAVCPRVELAATRHMTQSRGYLTVGEYTYDPAVTDFVNYTTFRICADNGEDTIFRSYAALQMADAVVYHDDTTGPGHARMVLEAPQVVYREDGSIDPDQSTVTMQDQTHAYLTADEDHELFTYSGHTSITQSFRQMFTDGYIPVTIAIFQGKENYVSPAITLSGEVPATFRELRNSDVTVASVYPIAVLRWVVYNAQGEEIHRAAPQITNKTHLNNGTVFSFPANNFTSLPNLLDPPEGATVQLTAIDTTGNTVVLGSFLL